MCGSGTRQVTRFPFVHGDSVGSVSPRLVLRGQGQECFAHYDYVTAEPWRSNSTFNLARKNAASNETAWYCKYGEFSQPA